MITEEEAWKQIEKRASLVGAGIAYRSDVFLLLASILAFYKVRGTEPQTMLSETLLSIVDRMIGHSGPVVGDPSAQRDNAE